MRLHADAFCQNLAPRRPHRRNNHLAKKITKIYNDDMYFRAVAQSTTCGWAGEPVPKAFRNEWFAWRSAAHTKIIARCLFPAHF